MHTQGQSIGGALPQPYGFEFAEFQIEELLGEAPEAKTKARKSATVEDPAEDIDYGRMQSAIKRNREWYR